MAVDGVGDHAEDFDNILEDASLKEDDDNSGNSNSNTARQINLKEDSVDATVGENGSGITVEDVEEEDEEEDETKETEKVHHHHHHLEEDDEDECRVCRGPAEEGRPLFSPCKCSGSIGLTHQDCLTSWLAVTRGEGRCELCKTKFRFAPQYDESAPTHLAVSDVLLGLLRRAVAKWLPFLLRSAFCMSLWLLVAPLMTAYLYRIWMHRNFACIQERWRWDLIPADIVGGAVLAAMILVSFLSLMSFADFLRVEWQQRQHLPNNGGAAGAGAANNNNGDRDRVGLAGRIRDLLPQDDLDNNNHDVGDNLDNNNHRNDDIDDGIMQHDQIRRLQQQQQKEPQEKDEEPAVEEAEIGEEREREQETGEEREDRGERDIPPPFPDNIEDAEEELREGIRAAAALGRLVDEARDIMEQDEEEQQRLQDEEDRPGNDHQPQLHAPRPPRPAQNGGDNANRIDEPQRALPRNPRVDREFDMGGFGDMDGDQVDMEINVALDELLGLRGPISSLIRNLLWLLVFNTVYLGFFAFIPKTIGSSVYSAIFNTTSFGNLLDMIDFGNTTITKVVNTTMNLTANATVDDITINTTITNMTINITGGLLTSLRNSIAEVNEESDRLNTAFRLPDFATINLGYFSMAFIIIVMRLIWMVSQKLSLIGRPGEGNRNDYNNTRLGRNEDDEDEDMDDNHERNERDRLRAEALNGDRLNMHAFDDQDMHPLVGDGFDYAPFSVSEGITLILDATVAVVKVGVLLFLKMFLLPVLLGLWLDGSTMDLFGFTTKDRILYAGKDLFSFILLHWVAGITFMLLVTVSVLQLREVTHPDLLAHLIRPQEPQPDLLGNLMHDSVLTQTKRMMLSLAIYTVLLNMHVSIPVRLLLSSGITDYLPFLHVKLWHVVMPQLQIPLELLVFHLSMLALLEKYKNSIGEMQHHWLKFMCKHMGLTDYLLPQNVEKFVLIGTIPVLSPDNKLKQLWLDILDKSEKEVDELILSNLDKLPPNETAVYDSGETKPSGERLLTSSKTFIRLPSKGLSLGETNEDATEQQNTERSNLLPTKLNSFRFKRRETSGSDLPVIEVWQEIPGKPIARPPEGWDDLGVGGADVQGRWAWGKEKKSTIEWGVAERTHFFKPGQENRFASFVIVSKVILLLLSSWFVTTLLLCVIVAFPLALGRFVYCILRVQERFIHYPLGFAVGSCIVFPSVALFATLLVSPNNDDTTLWQRIKAWLARFRFPSRRKLLVVLSTAFIWFVFCPLALGLIYELNLVKPSQWFSGEVPLVSEIADVVLCWTVGFVLLSAWACLCSLSVFTKDFWINIGNGMLDAPGNEEDVAADVIRRRAGNDNNNNNNDDQPIRGEENNNNINNNNNRRLRWQGKHGRISRFFAAWKSIILEWEWGAVDHVILMQECALPVAKQLSIPLVVSSSCCAVLICVVSLVFGWHTDYDQYRMTAFRIFCGMTIMVQLCIAFDSQIRNWFHAAHKTARDDRYLIGEILLNYEKES